jgi:hypothetical protein
MCKKHLTQPVHPSKLSDSTMERIGRMVTEGYREGQIYEGGTDGKASITGYWSINVDAWKSARPPRRGVLRRRVRNTQQSQ